MSSLINPDDFTIVEETHVAGGSYLHKGSDCPGNATCPVWLSINHQRLADGLVERFATIIGNAKISAGAVHGRYASATDDVFQPDGALWNSVSEIAGELAAINEAIWGTDGPIS